VPAVQGRRAAERERYAVPMSRPEKSVERKIDEKGRDEDRRAVLDDFREKRVRIVKVKV